MTGQQPFTRTVPFVVDTPMFLGSDTPERVNGWRSTSLRGVLHFWFRALAGRTVRGDLDALRRAEEEVFGSTTRQSPVTIRMRGGVAPVRAGEVPWLPRGQAGLLYLLGVGLGKPGGRGAPPRVERDHIPVGTKGEIDVLIRHAKPELIWDLVSCTLWTASTLGGLGARTHRGFGGFGVELNDVAASKVVDRVGDVGDRFTDAFEQLDVVGKVNDYEADYPVLLDDYWMIDVSQRLWAPTQWAGALNLGGELLREHRAPITSGRNRRTYEHRDVVVPFGRGERVNGSDFPIASFGLPIGFGKDEPKISTNGPGGNGKEGRRASPMWLRTARLSDAPNQIVLVSHAFTTQFLPRDHAVRIEKGNRNAPVRIDTEMMNDRFLKWSNDFVDGS